MYRAKDCSCDTSDDAMDAATLALAESIVLSVGINCGILGLCQRSGMVSMALAIALTGEGVGMEPGDVKEVINEAARMARGLVDRIEEEKARRTDVVGSPSNSNTKH